MSALYAEMEDWDAGIVRQYGSCTLFEDGYNDYRLVDGETGFTETFGDENEAIVAFWRHVHTQEDV